MDKRLINKYIIILFLTIGPVYNIISQVQSKFEIRKEERPLYFFQKGIKSDSISKNKNDLFYLIVHDSIKKEIRVQIENGKFNSTSNDSVFQVQYLPGMRYEARYEKSESSAASKKTKGPGETTWQFKCYVNGAAQFPKNKIEIKIVRTEENEVLIQNTFYYKD